MKKEAKKFQRWTQTLNAQTSVGQREVWTSEAKLVKEHGREEFDAHVASGRIRWRQDPWTYGVYNCWDQGVCWKESLVQEQTSYSRGQEYLAEQADDEPWDALGNKDLQGHLTDLQSGGKGKGKLALPKGKGKGKGKGKNEVLPIEDGSIHQETEEELGKSPCQSHGCSQPCGLCHSGLRECNENGNQVEANVSSIEERCRGCIEEWPAAAGHSQHKPPDQNRVRGGDPVSHQSCCLCHQIGQS